MLKKVEKILKENTLDGFSVAVKGELKRYVVANTHNEFIEGTSIEYISKIITGQAKENMYIFDNVTIGGWKDSKTGKIYIDAGMSTDDLDYAINCGKYTKQIALWDNFEKKEITLQYKKK